MSRSESAFAPAFDAARLRRLFADPVPVEGVREDDVPNTLRAAAVLVPLVMRDGGAPTVMLTRRTDHLHHHPGQVSFPGGRVEPGDVSPIDTALRETEEETGLARRHVEVLGRLPQYRTGTGFDVTPIVGLVTPPFELAPDPFEVAEVFEVPLGFLLDPANHQRHRTEIGGAWREYWAMPWQGYFIWGATAGMLVSLQRFLVR